MLPKTTILTAALPYANGDIHIGHGVEYIQADIQARHLRLKGERCFYVCADDAHGAPIDMRAATEGIAPEALIARIKREHERDFRALNISFDVYHSTHSPENRALVEDIYASLGRSGCLFTSEIDQLYDEIDGRFLADRYVRGNCPRCGAADQYGDACEKCGATYDALLLVNPVAVRTGATPVVRSSEQIFFDLPKCAGFLEDWRRRVGLQDSVNNKLDEWFKHGLRPWNISRDAPYFGFLIPGHSDKYFYVWLDAPVGYLASFKHLCDEAGLDDTQILNDPDVDFIHYIGKDIAYFHCLFWPAILHEAGRRLPTAVYCHGHLTVNGEKMSKSRGTQIPVSDLVQAIDADFFRYFIFSMLDNELDDIDLNLATFRERVNADLVGKIVNIASRSAAILQQVTQGSFSSDLEDESRFDQLLATLESAHTLIDERRYKLACRAIVSLAESVNKWLSVEQPWSLAKGEADDRQRAARICTQALVEFRAIMIALSPVVPALSERAKRLFGVDGADDAWTYGDLDPRATLARRYLLPYEVLAERITKEQISVLIQPGDMPASM